MTPEETLKICRYVKACLPQQAIDEFTPLAWHDHLEPYSYDDARAAAKTLTGAKAFVQIPELVATIRQIRAKRITAAGDLTPPPGLDVGETNCWLAQARRRIGDGEDPATVQGSYGELKPRHLPDLRAIAPRRPDEPDRNRRPAGAGAQAAPVGSHHPRRGHHLHL